MASQAVHTPELPVELQRDVQRKLGRCLIRLQQYEILLKALVAHGDIAGPPAGLQAVRDAQVACAQKKAVARLATEGWTLLNTATAWIRAQHPNQQPQRYGCGSWRHVIHESRQFEIRRTLNTEQGCGEVWYRSRQEGVSMQGKKAS